MNKDYYLVLNVPAHATPEQIRSAYRRRALELHPDTSGSSSDPFIELQEAYSVLGDPRQRADYDHSSEEIPIRRQPVPYGRYTRAEPLRGHREEPIRELSLMRSFESFGPSFDQLFDRLWSNFGILTRPKAERLESLTVDVPLTAEEALSGGTVRILVPARMACPRCRGRGHLGGFECVRCEGHGSLAAEYPVTLEYPPVQHDMVMQVPLTQLGIENFYLTVRFRIAGEA